MDVLQVELPLIQDQQHDLNQTLSMLQTNTWSCEGDTPHDTQHDTPQKVAVQIHSRHKLVCVCVCVCVCSGVQHLVEQQRERVLMFHSTVCKARANMNDMIGIIQVSDLWSVCLSVTV